MWNKFPEPNVSSHFQNWLLLACIHSRSLYFIHLYSFKHHPPSCTRVFQTPSSLEISQPKSCRQYSYLPRKIFVLKYPTFYLRQSTKQGDFREKHISVLLLFPFEAQYFPQHPFLNTFSAFYFVRVKSVFSTSGLKWRLYNTLLILERGRHVILW